MGRGPILEQQPTNEIREVMAITTKLTVEKRCHVVSKIRYPPK